MDQSAVKNISNLLTSLKSSPEEVHPNILDLANNNNTYMKHIRGKPASKEQKSKNVAHPSPDPETFWEVPTHPSSDLMSGDYDKQSRIYCIEKILQTKKYGINLAHFTMKVVCYHSIVDIISSSYQSSNFINEIPSRKKKLILCDVSHYVLEYNSRYLFEELDKNLIDNRIISLNNL